jgi:hypothetical protein
MSADKAGDGMGGFQVPYRLHDTVELDAAKPEPERLVGVPVGGFVSREVVWDAVELTLLSSETDVPRPPAPDASTGPSEVPPS